MTMNDPEITGQELSGSENAKDRASLWAATMSGSTDGKYTWAHSPILYIPFEGPLELPSNLTTGILDLKARLEVERLTLSPSATLSTPIESRQVKNFPGFAKSERIPLKNIILRTRFEHDRDRIKHFEAFRRLANKTQVHLDRSDHQRTRLTHSLEVEQIAVAIAQALRLNTALTSAIALGHDCGHGPGGHASEDALDPYLPEGFNHAKFGADVTLVPLNLCFETLDGIRNHSWSLDTPITPEGEVVSFADRIAYVCHDLEDALSCGMISPADYPKEHSWFMLQPRGEQIDHFIRAVISASIESGTIAMMKEYGELLSAMRAFNLERVYKHPISEKANEDVIVKLRELVDFLLESPDHLPKDMQADISDQKRELVPSVVEYVAGMTDNFAYRLHSELVRGRHIADDATLFTM
jgi:dGTPase